MSRTFGQELAGELIGKAVMVGSGLAGGLLLGPAGVAVGIATTVALICSGGSGDGSESHASQSNQPSSARNEEV
jgi:hypothetical protein